MTDYVLSGMVKRRAELSGEANALRNRLAQISADLVHLDAVIRQFDPDHDIPGIRPKRPRGTGTAERGEMSRFVLGVLREAPLPVTVATIAQQLLVECGVDVTDTKRARLMNKRVSMTLRHQERRGTVRAVRALGQAAVWEIVR